MTRTRTLLIIGVFMLSLAVLAGLEWRIQDPVRTEGQMVTGTLDRNVPPAPETVSSPQEDSLATGTSSSSGVFVPLDNGTLRGESGSLLDMTGTRPSPLQTAAPEHIGAAPLSAETPFVPEDPSGQISGTTAEAPVSSPMVSRPEGVSAPSAPLQAEEERSLSRAPAGKKNVVRAESSSGEFTLTARIPPLAAGQKGASSRLEVGKNVVFQMKGSGALKVRTMLLREPDRFVIDVEGNWGIGIPRVPDGLWLKGIRVGHGKDTTRIVFDLTRKPVSATAKNVDTKTVEVEIR